MREQHVAAEHAVAQREPLLVLWRCPPVMFIVERVVPGMTAELLAEVQRCLHAAAGRASGEGEVVRYLRCTFVPDQQRCLDLFEAASASAVQRVNDIAQVPFRWIAEASEYATPGSRT